MQQDIPESQRILVRPPHPGEIVAQCLCRSNFPSSYNFIAAIAVAQILVQDAIS